MTTSGTYAFAPDIQEFTDEAFARAKIEALSLTSEHLRQARRSLNLMFVAWANRGVHLFGVDQQSQALTHGTASYSVPSGTLAILECVIRRSGVDTPVFKIGREAYQMIPSKTQEGLPTQLYLDRKAGTYYLWDVPENSTDVLWFWRMRRIQDITAGQETADVSYLWFDALASGLAARLALIYNESRYALLKGEAAEAFQAAKLEDRERTDTSFSMRMR